MKSESLSALVRRAEEDGYVQISILTLRAMQQAAAATEAELAELRRFRDTVTGRFMPWEPREAWRDESVLSGGGRTYMLEIHMREVRLAIESRGDAAEALLMWSPKGSQANRQDAHDLFARRVTIAQRTLAQAFAERVLADWAERLEKARAKRRSEVDLNSHLYGSSTPSIQKDDTP